VEVVKEITNITLEKAADLPPLRTLADALIAVDKHYKGIKRDQGLYMTLSEMASGKREPPVVKMDVSSTSNGSVEKSSIDLDLRFCSAETIAAMAAEISQSIGPSMRRNLLNLQRSSEEALQMLAADLASQQKTGDTQ
jgi:hypothetical protein